MIDLHTHTIFSDGVLIPAELARRAADGDEKAKVELIQRVRAVAPAPSPEPADPANAA